MIQGIEKGPDTAVEQPSLILVEGQDDASFFKYFLRENKIKSTHIVSKNDGEAAQEGLWNFDAPNLEPIVKFLNSRPTYGL